MDDSIIAQSAALEQMRIFRRLLVTRCGVLAGASAIGGFGFHLLPSSASLFSVAVFLAPPAAAWGVERTRVRRLRSRVNELATVRKS